MRYLPIVTSTLLLVLHPVNSNPFSLSNELNNLFNLFNPNFKPDQQKQVLQPSPSPSPTSKQVESASPSSTSVITQQNSQDSKNQSNSNDKQSNNNGNNSTVADYQQLSQFMKQYGVELGTSNKPKIEATAPSTSSNEVSSRSGLFESIGNNVVQSYVNQNAQLINKMLQQPDQPFNVKPLFNNPVGGVLSLLGPLSGVNTNLPQNRNGPSVQQQVMDQGGSITLYSLVDLGVVYFYNNKGLYNALLGLLVQLLQLFPFLLDAVFRIIASVNHLFNPSLLNLILKFLYNYQAHSPANWVKLTELLSIFLAKDYKLSAQTLRDIIALAGEFPV
ncbi:hypothetical protein CONCODRAFT_6053 [Conidiobolus coronatus NRRL 28638]|uniref:Uncharacterized protein n=1 Tax=Conidiobolus coronatus (strain ATCC 28846 / CBS 209.66 / NRRL 28638) TaxID=796925 RepID=A0A137P8D7_CONC2|nr:hypothetical protein CONCODRAFT_6053 [Conidiobolus coronatus NRRL 28638]|eukprot:KXN71239.1 hypothetical protein CONCODRAFT_6053 [Conidiobolus coronatus NRRL 28638]